MKYTHPTVDIILLSGEDILTVSMGDNDFTMGPED